MRCRSLLAIAATAGAAGSGRSGCRGRSTCGHRDRLCVLPIRSKGGCSLQCWCVCLCSCRCCCRGCGVTPSLARGRLTRGRTAGQPGRRASALHLSAAVAAPATGVAARLIASTAATRPIDLAPGACRRGGRPRPALCPVAGRSALARPPRYARRGTQRSGKRLDLRRVNVPVRPLHSPRWPPGRRTARALAPARGATGLAVGCAGPCGSRGAHGSEEGGGEGPRRWGRCHRAHPWLAFPELRPLLVHRGRAGGSEEEEEQGVG